MERAHGFSVAVERSGPNDVIREFRGASFRYAATGNPSDGIIGQSPEWQRVLKEAAQVAVTDTTVFLQGESGTGKEVIARFVHRASPPKHGPFVAINGA